MLPVPTSHPSADNSTSAKLHFNLRQHLLLLFLNIGDPISGMEREISRRNRSVVKHREKSGDRNDEQGVEANTMLLTIDRLLQHLTVAQE